jgi:hypothetical protein
MSTPLLSARQQSCGVSTHTPFYYAIRQKLLVTLTSIFPQNFSKFNSAIRPNVQFSPASDLNDPKICLRDRCSSSHVLLLLIQGQCTEPVLVTPQVGATGCLKTLLRLQKPSVCLFISLHQHALRSGFDSIRCQYHKTS